ncbi:class I SAM-dependent methyltransferase [Sediminicoccus rosea]|uniref:Class I SAM-dependent methyltransferase n=1 Tax=Sediminicoccus rosea TaxID=1225128 RepID=A0ABZ0PEA4_9PROT|nr:class I SAM-dependent methyltransferase [Sediminicoccus rosea]WPB83530.1 class I SAM-dependent methyltransferase [Sediminicoccus rosea]
MRFVARNIYDDPAFFAGYAGLERSRLGLDGAPEWPRLQAMLPPVEGLRVADLGCGYGWFCRWARQAGAARVLGLDLSRRMLDAARARTEGEGITYVEGDLAALALPEARFDLVFSSLAFHYVADFGRLLAAIRQGLAPGGRLVFSIEHPLLMAPRAPGWRREADGRLTWPVDAYLEEGPRETHWFVPGVVKHHRSLATTLNSLVGAGFALARLEEFGPSAEQVASRPEWAKERERPLFLLVSAAAL